MISVSTSMPSGLPTMSQLPLPVAPVGVVNMMVNSAGDTHTAGNADTSTGIGIGLRRRRSW